MYDSYMNMLIHPSTHPSTHSSIHPFHLIHPSTEGLGGRLAGRLDQCRAGDGRGGGGRSEGRKVIVRAISVLKHSFSFGLHSAYPFHPSIHPFHPAIPSSHPSIYCKSDPSERLADRPAGRLDLCRAGGGRGGGGAGGKAKSSPPGDARFQALILSRAGLVAARDKINA